MDLQARALSASSPLSNEYKTTHLLFEHVNPNPHELTSSVQSASLPNNCAHLFDLEQYEPIAHSLLLLHVSPSAKVEHLLSEHIPLMHSVPCVHDSPSCNKEVIGSH